MKLATPIFLVLLTGGAFAGALVARQPANPRPVLIWVRQIHPGWIRWRSQNANEVVITDLGTGAIVGGDRPPSGSVLLPPGTYQFKAIGDRDRFAAADVVVP